MKFIFWLFLASFVIAAVIILIAIFTEENLRDNRELFELSIIHFGDLHARFDEINEISLLPCDKNEESCIGGIARMKTFIDFLISKRKNAIVLNAGDNFQGTIWHNLLRSNVTSHFLNLLPIDVNVLGNHEFDHGIDELLPLIKSLYSPVVLANLDDEQQVNFRELGIKVSKVTAVTHFFQFPFNPKK